jgi:5-methylcytosine-specific restriction endonuclease McrA
LALGRPSATLETWREIRAQVSARAQWRCQACRVRTRLEVHHVVKRAQGGSDFDLDRLVALCPACHAQTDAPYGRGRLVVTPLGQGQFTCTVVRGADKWTIRR